VGGAESQRLRLDTAATNQLRTGLPLGMPPSWSATRPCHY